MFQLLLRHWSKILIAVLTVTASIFCFDRLFSSNKAHLKKDYWKAQRSLDEFYSGQLWAMEIIDMMENIVLRHPELHPKCDFVLAQCLLEQEEIEKAIRYTSEALARIEQDFSSPYQQFTRTTLLIAEKKYEHALQEALVLQPSLKEESAKYEMLQVFNLLRIVSLTQDKALKKENWEKLRKHPGYAKVENILREKNYTYTDYIEERLRIF